MLITRTSMVSKVTRTMNLDITERQAQNYMDGWNIQDAFPNLTADEREFIMTGITSEEWDSIFPEE